MSAARDIPLSHFAARPVAQIGARTQEATPALKPVGLWVSVDGDDDWESWCLSEDFGKERLAIRHRVTLADEANILQISSVDDLDLFSARYGSTWRPQRDTVRDLIDWRRVAEHHDGIIIAPYQWARRLDGDARWYYGWDCASGCIWKPRAIASIEVICDLMRERAA